MSSALNGWMICLGTLGDRIRTMGLCSKTLSSTNQLKNLQIHPQ
jgi:hypothetical protein